MKTKHKVGLGILLAAVLVAVTGWYLSRYTVAVLEPAGKIAKDERNLMALCIAISGGIVIPVFGLLGYFAWKYREGNRRAKYAPDLDGNKAAEAVWWVIPTILLVVISTITWRSSYALDPFQPIDGKKATMHIQVVAMDWKWLFIYPDQQIASVNEAAIPVGQPVDFEITSDTVMTGFWVPQLAGQMYAMPGMATHLNLIADKAGTYKGSASNISGQGFADMSFDIKAVSDKDFDAWQIKVAQSTWSLTDAHYGELSQPGVMKKPFYYSSITPGMFDTIMMKYMMPMSGTTELHGATE